MTASWAGFWAATPLMSGRSTVRMLSTSFGWQAAKRAAKAKGTISFSVRFILEIISF